MARGGKRNPEKERFWRRMVRRWRRSPSTVREFCAMQRLGEPSFHAWRRLLDDRDREVQESAFSFVPVRVAGMQAADVVPAPGTRVPVGAVSAAASSWFEVVIGARVVRVPAGFDAATLRQLLDVLEGGRSC